MPIDPAAEKRGSQRVPVRLEVNFQSIDSFLSEYAMNISRGGLFVSTRKPLDVGTKLTLQFTIPDAAVPIKINGEVAWVTTYDKASQLIPGMGIKFRELSDGDRKKLEEFIDSLKPQTV